MNPDLPQRVIDVPLPPPTESIGQKIVMFGRETCPDCARIRKFFAANAIQYEYHDIDTDKSSLKWIQSFSQSIPVLVMLDGTVLYSPSDEELHSKIQGASVNQKVAMVEPTVFDVIIVGAGAAGITATIYAVRKLLKVLIVSKNIGGQAALSGDIENYPGFTMISGADLAYKFRQEVERFKNAGLWIKEGYNVTTIEGSENSFQVKTENGGIYHGKNILIASGRIPRMLGVLGEKEFLGRGVATCATCDAPLYKGRDVMVVGGGNSALDAAISLLKIAKTVSIINNQGQLRGDSIMLEKVQSAPNVTILNNHEVLQIKGTKFVQGVVARDKVSGEEKEYSTDGVFIEIGWIPSADFVPPQVQRNERDEIVVDEMGKTSFDGIWAAGDVNNLWGEQIVIAAGEGAKIALAIAEHIAKLPHQATSNIHHEA